MKKNNRIAPGKWSFSFRDAPPSAKKPGCSLHRGTISTPVGPEVFALFREDAGYAEQLGDVEPFVLIVHAGFADTPHGKIAFIVWQIASDTANEILVEQYLNPTSVGALALVKDAADQIYFNFITINRESGDVTVFVQFENNFGFDVLYSNMLEVSEGEACANFDRAVSYIGENYSVKDLVAISMLS